MNEQPQESELRATKSVSPDGLEALRNIIDVAVSGNMMSQSDANKVMAILHCNPAMRLTRVFQRIRSVEKLLNDMQVSDMRMNSIMRDCHTELAGIRDCAECSPFFDNDSYGEGGKKSV